MSFLDLYQGDQEQAAAIQPNEGTRLPSGFDENFQAAWSDGRLFSQSVARANARASVLSDYVDEIKQKTGNDLSKEFVPDTAGGGSTGVTDFDTANARVADLKAKFPDLDLNPMTEDDINARAIAKAQSAHRNYEALQAGERTSGGAAGSFLGSAASSAADPINVLALAVAPETGGIGILSSALRWGAVAGVSQAAIEGASDSFKEQVQPGYTESGAPIKEVAGAFLGGAVLGGGIKALGSAWTRVKTGAWPTSVRDAGNVIESEANVAASNPFPGVEGEVAHREALTKTIDDVLAGRPADVSQQITPEMEAHFEAYHGSPHDFDAFDLSKIGTGEGAQVYGHGLYFAENEGVAKNYSEMSPVTASGAEDLARQTYLAAGEDREAAAARLRDYASRNPNPANEKMQLAAADFLDSGTPIASPKLYRVRITADKDKFLDLDKRLNEQAPEVQASLKQAMGIDYYGKFDAAKSERIWNEFQNANGKAAVRQGFIASDDERVSQLLSDAGIPGSKYLDSGSRDDAEGTRNFVVFDDKHVEVTHKNGKPVNAEIRQGIVDQAAGLPPKQSELDLQPQADEPAPKVDVNAPQPALQTADQMNDTLATPDHQEAIRADIDRARAMGDVQVPGVDEFGNHKMVGVDAAMDEVDAYKQAAEQIQACANPVQEAAE